MSDNVKGVPKSDELKRESSPKSAVPLSIMELYSEFQLGPQLYSFGSLSQHHFRPQQAAVFSFKKALQPPLLRSTKPQTDIMSIRVLTSIEVQTCVCVYA